MSTDVSPGASVSGTCEAVASEATIQNNSVSVSSDNNAGWFRHYQEFAVHELPSDEMKSLVVDYLISEGYREAAELLCSDAGIAFPKDSAENLDARMAIRDAIVDGRIEEAIYKINNLVPELLATNSLLHLQLLQQHLIELIRQKKLEESLKFAEEFLVEKCEKHPEMQEKLEKTFSLLAFEKPEESPFASLVEVATEVNSAVLKALHKPAVPRIEALFRMVVWAGQQLKRETEPSESNEVLSSAVDYTLS
uniref:CTLH domain-containing protein n=1 Tax=Syphacia muris TaxID=451379 RepID=A0A0N5AEP4_9BILA